jgi:UDP-N-acetylmuramate: L-alanyl-gamma-D-glutamyl-meso-diaminopimelate ligase
MAREHVHLIGIGGTGMSALAGLLRESGCRVTGSDHALYPPTSDILAALDVEVGVGFDAARLDPPPDLVIVGNAVSRGNPEVEAVLDRQLPCTSMPRAIADRFLRGRHPIVIAGTHGKTTTTSLLAWVLLAAGRDPGFLIGGMPRDIERPFALGTGPEFVIEGDEYDSAFFDKGPKLMHYMPGSAAIGTVEFDHADVFADERQVKAAFRNFARIVPRNGLLVRDEECAGTREVTDGAPCRVEGFGIERGRWTVADVRAGAEGVAFRVLRDGRPHLEASTKLHGLHNVRNALAVVALAHDRGVDPADVAKALGTFRGVRRRLEHRGTAWGVTVVDDFAHHPTAIRVTLEAVRGTRPAGRVVAVVEPRSASMRRNVFRAALGTAFDAADEVLLGPVYRAEALPEAERLDPAGLAHELGERGVAARAFDGVDAIVEHIVRTASPGDVLVVMSNGDFGGLHERVLERLRAREESAARTGR